jgi:AcrR family transcriptional regulator
VNTRRVDRAPDPPWWDTGKREPRSGLTREAIVEAAIDVLDEEGLDGLTMRRVADELGAGAASLYWHISDKEQLINLILDRIMGELELPEPDPEHWEEQLRWFAHAGRDMYRRHRDVAVASLGRVPMGPNLVRIAEWLLGLMHSAGIPTRAASWFTDVFALVGAAQAAEDHIARTGAAPMLEAMGQYLAALSPTVFPNIAAVGEDMISGDADERFEFAIDLLLRGLATYVEDA